ncbi:MAG: HEAT repeat domain-containing protein, partial [Candidatus Omnitrophota bacterium]|nr:HEAT repeat domain-containing protein [Candidatus Omnitrophota bacterium]
VRIACADALGELGDRKASSFLAEALLEDHNHEVRSSCAFSLGKVGTNKAIPALIKALNDEYRDVVVYSQDSLISITGKNIKGYNNWQQWWEDNKDLLE